MQPAPRKHCGAGGLAWLATVGTDEVGDVMGVTEAMGARDQILLSLYSWRHSGRVGEMEEEKEERGKPGWGELPRLRGSGKGLEQVALGRSIQILSKAVLHCQTKPPADAAGAQAVPAVAEPAVASAARPEAGLCSPLGTAWDAAASKRTGAERGSATRRGPNRCQGWLLTLHL